MLAASVRLVDRLMSTVMLHAGTKLSSASTRSMAAESSSAESDEAPYTNACVACRRLIGDSLVPSSAGGRVERRSAASRVPNATRGEGETGRAGGQGHNPQVGGGSRERQPVERRRQAAVAAPSEERRSPS